MITKILRVICVLCAAACVLCAVAMFAADRLLYSEDLFVKTVDDEYVAYIHGMIASAIEDNEEYYGFDTAYLTNRIDDGIIEEISTKYYRQLYGYIHGTEDGIEPTVYPSDGFAEGILEFAGTLENIDMFDSEAAAEVSQDAADTASGCFSVIPEEYLDIAKGVICSKLSLVGYYYIAIIAAFVFAALCVVLPKSSLLPKLTLAASSFFVPSFGLFVFMLATYLYDFGGKILIAESPLRQFVIRYIGSACRITLTCCGAVAAVSGIAMTALLVIRAVHIVKKSNDNE